MMDVRRWLVVGGDGLIGKRLVQEAQSADRVVLGSSRRNINGQPYVDLNTGDTDAALATAPEVVILCAAVTSIQKCRDEPEMSTRINVDQTVRLAAQFLQQGAFVIFLSSNTVFNGNVERPDEYAPLEPVTEYGAQKAKAEVALQALPGAEKRLAIVRLSKVIAPSEGLAVNFLRHFQAQQSCRAFDDLRMAPVSLRYVVDGLLALAFRCCPGVFHLSGRDELSYAEFARALARRVGVPSTLVETLSSQDAGVEVLFRPRFPALGMTRTHEVLGLAPESLEQVIDTLFAT